jgi:TetR/AcrR family transcriptional regulator, mexJK operon transcriptional repressor
VIPTPSRSVGRPRDAEKREAILDTAWAMFLERGVQSTALDAVARQAGVSRVTLYSHFADKTALFETAVEREFGTCKLLQRAGGRVTPPPRPCAPLL